MSGPWTKFQAKTEDEKGPWSNYQSAAPASAPEKSTSPYAPENLPQFMQNPVGRTWAKVAGGINSAGMGATQGATLGFGDEITVGAGALYGAGVADGGVKDRTLGAAFGGTIGAGTKFGLDKAGRVVAPLFKAKPKAAAVPELDDLKAAKNALYQKADDQGAVYSPEQLAGLYQGVQDAIPNQGLGRITSRTHPTTMAMQRQMAGQGDNAATLTELDRLRQLSGSASVTNPADQRLSGIIRQNIDEFTEATAPSAGGDASQILKQARAANSRFRKSEMIDEAITKGTRRAQSTGSGGNTQNAIRQNIRAILDNPKKRRGYTPDEIAQMDRVVAGSGMQNLTRTIGKLSPEGNGLMTALGIGGAAANPMLGLGSLAGFASKRHSDKLAQGSIDDLVRLIRTGQSQAPIDTRASQAVQDKRLQELLARMAPIGMLN